MEIHEIVFEKLRRSQLLLSKSMPVSEFMILCKMASDPGKKWTVADFQNDVSLTRMAINTTLNRLKSRALADQECRITARGLDIVCWRPNEERSEPIQDHNFFINF